jgi:FtsZ-binding cell division protein ZapB
MDEDLLYGDIESAGKDIEIQLLQELLEAEKKKNEALTVEVSQLQGQVKVLVADRTQLETNMMTFYNTAKLELKRKDSEIADLRGSSRNCAK